MGNVDTRLNDSESNVKTMCEKLFNLLNEEGLLQGMRRVSYQVRVWKVEVHGLVLSDVRDRRKIPACLAGRASRETFRPDTQTSSVPRGKSPATVPHDPLFNPGSLRHYVSKNSAHPFGRYWRKRDEWHRRGAPHLRV